MAEKVGISNVRHIKVAGESNTFCGWPWTGGGIHSFGKGELAVVFTEAACRYEKPQDIDHGNVDTTGREVLRRSLDHGETWPKELEVVIRDNAVPFSALFPGGEIGYHPEVERPRIDMSKPESMLCAWRCFCRDPYVANDGVVRYRPICFVLRSGDKGHTWESVPNLVPNAWLTAIWGGSHYLKRSDGVLLLATSGDLAPSSDDRSVLYGSPDDGVTWYFISTIAQRDDGATVGYPCPRALPDGRIISSVGFRPLWGSWTSIVYSEDEGCTWTQPRRINRWGDQASLLLLRDGRLVCAWGYRYKPYGIRGKVSEDFGETWSEELVIRDDGASGDLGYPVLAELDDGRLFAAYYFNVEDGTNMWGGRRFIGGTFFELL